MIKPDVLVGGRGKAGMVHEVGDPAEAQKALKRIQGQEVRGHVPRTAYLVEFVDAEIEVYSAITYDSRYEGPSMTLSLAGGMDIEEVGEDKKTTFPVNVYKGLDAYQAGEALEKLGYPSDFVSTLSRALVDLWDMFASTGMRMCEVNPWRVTAEGKPYACDFKATFDEANFKFRDIGFQLPEYPADSTPFEEEMSAWNA